MRPSVMAKLLMFMAWGSILPMLNTEVTKMVGRKINRGMLDGAMAIGTRIPCDTGSFHHFIIAQVFALMME
jgi:hypothetical protein